MPEITQEYVQQLIEYDPRTGVAHWKVDKGTARKGDKIQSISTKGYYRISIDRRRISLHRVIWLYVYGTLPDLSVDHINRNKTDNRIVNLRLATNRQQHQNKSAQKNNTSGYVGVTWNKHAAKWVAQIWDAGVAHYLGVFDSKEGAAQAYAEAKSQMHEHAA